MLDLYWIFFITGVSVAVISVIFGEIIGSFLDGILDALSIDGLDFLNPIVIFGGMTVFGASGILFTKYTSQPPLLVGIYSFLIAAFISVIAYLAYVKPMEDAETSTGFSIHDLNGKIGEVITTIPAAGYGEVIVQIGGGNTNQIAGSFDKEEIQSGTRVVVVEVKNNVLYVSRFENI